MVLELKDQRAPQAFFSGEQAGRFFIPEPISGGEETATCITYIQSIRPVDALEKLPLEFPVRIHGFHQDKKVSFCIGLEFRDGSAVPEEILRISFEATLCEDW